MTGSRNAPLQTGVLYCDDNLERLSSLPSESVDLIYLDPPFFSNRHYEVIWGDEAEVRSFNDRWDGGIYQYVDWMKHRIREMKRVLRPAGTIFLHCDHHASHYLKVMMDEIFGTRQFLNEIIWHYESASGAPKKWLHRNHDTILRYAATNPKLVTWNHPLNPWPETTLAKWQTDKDGIYHMNGGRKYYINPDGKYDDDVWDITFSTRSKERLGYPTQKPEALLDKIIKASSNKGDTVLDPFCGCGTALVVAERLERQWVGIDISPTAVNLMKRRLERATHGQCKPSVQGLPISVDDLKKLRPFEFQNWVIAKVVGTSAPRKSGDMGIDGYSFMLHEPIQVKQSENVGRNVVDNFETAIRRAGNDSGYIIAFSFGTGAKKEVARVRVQENVDITLVTVKQLLDMKPETKPIFRVPAAVAQLKLAEIEDTAPLGAPRKPNLPSYEALVESSKTA
jgi:DNA modification methylase